MTLGWIAFAAELPRDHTTILVTHLSTGDEWREYLSPKQAENAGVNGMEPAPFAHLEVMTVESMPFGIRLFRGYGTGAELSRSECQELMHSGYWLPIVEFFREVGPFDEKYLVNGHAGEVIG